jgi:hypothetical protein
MPLHPDTASERLDDKIAAELLHAGDRRPD